MSVKELETVETEESIGVVGERFLILYNDDYHTFDYVIDALVDICGHTREQALQCALLVHFKGKCDVETGTYEYLRPKKTALANKDLTVTID
ncbi:MAG: ATP-dependent Clp protease adaptor ClpS [Bacteroidales bacterium]|jgi:ATP-dependent Clp protease adaptor protein ClpS|nr:ATP-dependent Clp protease adaptor ClpS [Bacteroidales bacterium]